MAPSQHDWKIVDWDVKPQHNQPTYLKEKGWSVGKKKIFFVHEWG